MSRIVILGGGESGYGSAVLAKEKGFDVFLSDSGKLCGKYRSLLEEEKIAFEEGGHTENLILNADEIIKSPGIPDDIPLLVHARAMGIHIVSEIEFAGRYNSARTICITGSNGKTTTTTLIYEILTKAGFNVGLAGNIGNSFAYQVARCKHDWYVIELSSFQLDGMEDFRADISVLMNITPDHLDRYSYDMEKYASSKMRILQNQTYINFFVYCMDDENISRQLAGKETDVRTLPFTIHERAVDWQGACLVDKTIKAHAGNRFFEIKQEDLQVQGIHNTYNVMAAILSTMAAGVSDNDIQKAITAFSGVEHRLEEAGSINGTLYINDSKATNVDSAWYALESMRKPVIWIAGGTDKGNDYTALTELARKKVKTLICLGIDNTKLIESFTGIVPEILEAASMEKAMETAKSISKGDDIVLLSPACASFDLFLNYEDRGNQFKEWVKTNKEK